MTSPHALADVVVLAISICWPDLGGVWKREITTETISGGVRDTFELVSAQLALRFRRMCDAVRAATSRIPSAKCHAATALEPRRESQADYRRFLRNFWIARL